VPVTPACGTAVPVPQQTRRPALSDPSPPPHPAAAGLAWFNALPPGQAERELLVCCAAPGWAAAVAAGRPYADLDRLCAASDAAFADLDSADVDIALAAHPRIGERAEGAGRETAWSRQEQSGTRGADDALQHELRQANLAYERRFGHVFLIRATGRSAAEMLAECRRRLANDPATERREVLGQLRAITRLRLEKLLEGAQTP